MKTIANTAATLFCTFIMSATLIAAAIGPAQAGGNAAVASAARIVA